MKHYHINVFFSAADDGWIADVPDLQCCSAFGETPETAVAEVRTAMQAWLETARQLRKPIPKPTYRPAIYQLAAS
ncbi:MAG: type II toxin-antitoxin system HicB family antitoxin [Verrucomicrobia bacterium]|nr:type II toxin-antitoxin system HicB family antitoxin [Verrucomicrobiota bacterium]